MRIPCPHGPGPKVQESGQDPAPRDLSLQRSHKTDSGACRPVKRVRRVPRETEAVTGREACLIRTCLWAGSAAGIISRDPILCGVTSRGRPSRLTPCALICWARLPYLRRWTGRGRSGGGGGTAPRSGAGDSSRLARPAGTARDKAGGMLAVSAHGGTMLGRMSLFHSRWREGHQCPGNRMKAIMIMSPSCHSDA